MYVRTSAAGTARKCSILTASVPERAIVTGQETASIPVWAIVTGRVTALVWVIVTGRVTATVPAWAIATDRVTALVWVIVTDRVTATVPAWAIATARRAALRRSGNHRTRGSKRVTTLLHMSTRARPPGRMPIAAVRVTVEAEADSATRPGAAAGAT
jgi:hypothetical protein